MGSTRLRYSHRQSFNLQEDAGCCWGPGSNAPQRRSSPFRWGPRLHPDLPLRQCTSRIRIDWNWSCGLCHGRARHIHRYLRSLTWVAVWLGMASECGICMLLNRILQFWFGWGLIWCIFGAGVGVGKKVEKTWVDLGDEFYISSTEQTMPTTLPLCPAHTAPRPPPTTT